jgi:transposase
MKGLPKLSEVPDELPEDTEALKSLVRTLACERQMLQSSLEQALRKRFGTSSEQLARQLDIFASTANDPPAEEPKRPPCDKPRTRKGHGRRPAAVHLERQRVVHDVSEEDKLCPCCMRQRPLIGESKSEQYDYRPASVFVIEHVTLKYGECPCGSEEAGGVVEAAKPLQAIDKGLCAAGLLAYVAVSKYADHLPLYRLERILARHGLDVDRSTLWGWLCKGGEQLEELVALMREKILSGEVISSDDTPLPLQEKGRGKTRKARIWIYAGDPEHPYVLYDFRMDRSRAGPEKFLGKYKGYLQVDAYAGYDVVFVPEGATEVGCWAHARRRFFDAFKLGCTRSEHALKHFIQPLYVIEREAKALDAKALVARRREKALPLLEEFFAWMQKQQLEVLPQSPVGKALSYALDNRQALTRYTEHAYLQIDNNASERGMRPVVVGRKNWLFTGSERGGKTAAVFFSVIESARRHGLDVFAYLHDLFRRLPAHPHSRIEDFLPDRWKSLQQNSQPADQTAPVA